MWPSRSSFKISGGGLYRRHLGANDPLSSTDHLSTIYLTLTCRASANGSHTYSLPNFNIAWHFLMGESGTPRSWRNLNLRVLQSDDTVHSLMREGLWCKVYDARVQHSVILMWTLFTQGPCIYIQSAPGCYWGNYQSSLTHRQHAYTSNTNIR